MEFSSKRAFLLSYNVTLYKIHVMPKTNLNFISNNIDPIQEGPFRGCLRMGSRAKRPPL